MYKIMRKFELSCSHRLELDYESPCRRIHGHNYMIEVELSAPKLDSNGMVLDFKVLKNIFAAKVRTILDYKDIDKVLPFNTTTEYLAYWILNQINYSLTGMSPHCTKVTVYETGDCCASWEASYESC